MHLIFSKPKTLLELTLTCIPTLRHVRNVFFVVLSSIFEGGLVKATRTNEDI
jgi:hypothetical protein